MIYSLNSAADEWGIASRRGPEAPRRTLSCSTTLAQGGASLRPARHTHTVTPFVSGHMKVMSLGRPHSSVAIESDEFGIILLKGFLLQSLKSDTPTPEAVDRAGSSALEPPIMIVPKVPVSPGLTTHGPSGSD